MKTNSLLDIEAERALLAAIADCSGIEGIGATREAVEGCGISAEDFARVEHAEVFRAALELLTQGRAVDEVALGSMLKPSTAFAAAGGVKWLAEMLRVGHKSSGLNLGQYASTVRDLAVRRRVVEHARRVAGEAMDLTRPTDGTLKTWAEAVDAVVNRQERLTTAEQTLIRVLDEMEQVDRGERIPVIPTGLAALDAVIAGLQPTLTMVGAYPGVGKSSLFASILESLAKRRVKVGLFSLEDDGTWVARRLLAGRTNIPVHVIQFRRLVSTQKERVAEASAELHSDLKSIVIDDRSRLTPAQIVQTARDMVLNHKCKALFVDHLGEVAVERDRGRHDLEVGDALSQLRALAKRYGVPVVVATHLKRREGADLTTEPRLSDFANSSAVEGMARVALGLSKPDPQTLRVSVLKQTNGAGGVAVDLEFIGAAALVCSAPSSAVPDLYGGEDAA